MFLVYFYFKHLRSVKDIILVCLSQHYIPFLGETDIKKISHFNMDSGPQNIQLHQVPKHSSPLKGPSHPLPYLPRHGKHDLLAIPMYISVNEIIQCVTFCVQFFSYSMVFSKFNHILSYLILIKCAGLITFRCTNTPKFSLSICPLMDMWLAPLGNCKQCCSEHGHV